MAKKKTKAASNRGFATTSSPSKKVEPIPIKETPVKEETVEIVKEIAQSTDDLLLLVQKYRSLHDHKAELMVDRLSKEESQASTIRKVRSFRLSSDLESDLVTIIKQSRSNLFGKFETRYYQAKNNPFFFIMTDFQAITKESEKEKTVAHLDLLYRVLTKFGFNDQDVLDSLKTTLSKSLDDHLDWVKKIVNISLENSFIRCSFVSMYLMIECLLDFLINILMKRVKRCVNKKDPKL